MIDKNHIEDALDRLVRLGPDGALDPHELCTVLGIDHEALKRASEVAALDSTIKIMEEFEEGMPTSELFQWLAIEHMVGFLVGVTAHHMASESA